MTLEYGAKFYTDLQYFGTKYSGKIVALAVEHLAHHATLCLYAIVATSSVSVEIAQATGTATCFTQMIRPKFAVLAIGALSFKTQTGNLQVQFLPLHSLAPSASRIVPMAKWSKSENTALPLCIGRAAKVLILTNSSIAIALFGSLPVSSNLRI
jgi:hypothetical protein